MMNYLCVLSSLTEGLSFPPLLSYKAGKFSF